MERWQIIGAWLAVLTALALWGFDTWAWVTVFGSGAH